MNPFYLKQHKPYSLPNVNYAIVMSQLAMK